MKQQLFPSNSHILTENLYCKHKPRFLLRENFLTANYLYLYCVSWAI